MFVLFLLAGIAALAALAPRYGADSRPVNKYQHPNW
jgi:hypothetical protein